MTSHVEDLLSRARLVHEPYTQADIDAAERRLAARIADPPPAPAPFEPAARDERAAARDLRTLCETIVASTALDVLGDAFVLAQPLPDPEGARVLGCILQLTRSNEAARDWWQYAAGAGDAAAAYCLHLHHLARGELTEARWWHAQTERTVTPTPALKEPAPADPTPAKPDVPFVITTVLDQAALTDFSILPTTLRLIDALRKRRGVSAEWPTALRALLDYVPAAVGYVDEDLDLPLPDPGFTDRIRALTARRPKPPRPRRHGKSTLPERPPPSVEHSPCRRQEKTCT
ncbi:hypothetical protein [Streptomyces niveus]|uniref:hypothetical protein n=1 Tax=Streptomyces niveus TaxID=193462 RepID=UPI00084CD935|nr:hypothetical protein [Streptomyces niveus]